MKEEAVDKICRKIDTAYMYAQVVFAMLIIVASVCIALTSAINEKYFITMCFGAIAYVGYKLMLRTSLSELREYKKNER